jgi:hypothetical protein
VTDVEKGLIIIVVIIAAGLLGAWVFNANLTVKDKTIPTYKIGDIPVNAYKSSMEKFSVEGK